MPLLIPRADLPPDSKSDSTTALHIAHCENNVLLKIKRAKKSIM